jgi:hypothetical protein
MVLSEGEERRGMIAAALFLLLVTGKVIKYLMGRRRNRDGQSAYNDDPGRQGVQAGRVVLGLPIVGTPGRDVDRSPVVMMPMRLVMVPRLIMVPFLGLIASGSPPVGHGRSAEKSQSHCQNDCRFKGFGQHVVTSFGSRTVFVESAVVLSVRDVICLARGFGERDGGSPQKVYNFFYFPFREGAQCYISICIYIKY